MPHRTRLSSLALAFGAVSLAPGLVQSQPTPAPAGPVQAARAAAPAASAVAPRVVVAVKFAPTVLQREALLERLKALGAESLDTRQTKDGPLLVSVPPQSLEAIRAIPGVRSVGGVRDAERWPGHPDR